MIAESGLLRLHSLNPIYLPYSIHVNEIREVWRFVHYICAELPEERPAEMNDRSIREIKGILKTLINGLETIQTHLFNGEVDFRGCIVC